MIERLQQINRLKRKSKTLEVRVEKWSSARNLRVERFNAATSLDSQVREAAGVERATKKIANFNIEIERLNRVREEFAQEGLAQFSVDQVLPGAIQHSTPAEQQIPAPETIEKPATRVEQTPATLEPEKPKKEFSRATKEWIMPNGKIIMLTSNRSKIIGVLEKGPTTGSQLKKKTGLANNNYNIPEFNSFLKKYKMEIVNLNPGKGKDGLWTLAWRGTEKQIVSSKASEKRRYVKEANGDIYTRGVFSEELPNGQTIEISGGLNHAILDAMRKGIFSRDEIAVAIYGEATDVTRQRVTTGMNHLNLRLEPYNYKLVHTTRAEIKSGAPFIYRWEEILSGETEVSTEDKISDEESFHLANLFHAWNAVLEREEYRPLSTEAIVKIREKLGEDYKVDPQKVKEGRLNAIKHVREIAAKINDETIDKICSKQDEECQELLLQAVIEPESYDFLEELIIRGVTPQTITDREGFVIDYSRKLNFLTKREKRLLREKAETEQKQHFPGGFVEEGASEDEISRAAAPEIIPTTNADVFVATHEEVLQDALTSSETVMPTTHPVVEEQIEQPTRYKAILARDPEALKTVRTIIGNVLKQFPEGVTTGQLAKDFGIKHSRVLLATKNGYIKGPVAKGRGVPRLSPADTVVLVYLDQHDENSLSTRAIKDLARMAGEKVREVQEKINNRLKQHNGNN